MSESNGSGCFLRIKVKNYKNSAKYFDFFDRLLKKNSIHDIDIFLTSVLHNNFRLFNLTVFMSVTVTKIIFMNLKRKLASTTS